MGAHFSVSLFFFMLRAFSVSYTLVRKFKEGNMFIFLSFLDWKIFGKSWTISLGFFFTTYSKEYLFNASYLQTY